MHDVYCFVGEISEITILNLYGVLGRDDIIEKACGIYYV